MKTTKDVGISGDNFLVIDIEMLKDRAAEIARNAPLTKEGNNDGEKLFKYIRFNLISIQKAYNKTYTNMDREKY